MSYIIKKEYTITIPEDTMNKLQSLLQVLVSYEKELEEHIKKMKSCNLHCKFYDHKQAQIEFFETQSLIIADNLDALIEVCGK